MKHFYIIANLDKEYVQEAQVFIKAYLEAKGAECLLHHTPERTRGAAHIDGAQVPEDTECVITIGGDGTLIQAARDLAGRNSPMVGVNRGHLGYLNQVSRQEDIAPVLESLLNERYQLERRMMIHGTAWRREETLLKDIALNEIAITRKDPLKARSIVLAPEDRVRIKVLNSGQVVSFDGDTSMELKAGDCIDIRCSELQTVMIKVKQISFMQNLSNHLGGI